MIGDFIASIKKARPQATSGGSVGNVQTTGGLKPAMNIDPAPATGDGGITVVDDSALLPQEGPSGTLADIVKPKNAGISRYVVQNGDTLSSIAAANDISINTIRWANNLSSKSSIQPGQVLIILPITSVRHTIAKGDTLESIAKKYNADAGDIAAYNGLDETSLTVGTAILVPNGEVAGNVAAVSRPASPTSTTKKPTTKSSSDEPAHDVGPKGTASQVAYYISPLSHYIETQGIHGYNAVDLADPIGTPIVAAADGDVVVARAGGWNGGYGSYVVIQHDNGSETLYAHMSKVSTYDGAHVDQGDVIGYVGQTGKATGPHLHFEIRNGIKNPF